jgi:hypothetical protein
MSVLKAPPRLIRNATIQVRVEEDIDIKLKKYAEFIDATPAFVVAESLKMLFKKDAEFREWLVRHGDKPADPDTQKPVLHEPTRTKSSMRATFDQPIQNAVNK